MKKPLLVLVGLYALLVMTNQWLGFETGLNYVDAEDAFLYKAISLASPKFVAEPIAYHHAQRFFFPYLAGIIAQFLHLPFAWVYNAFLTGFFLILIFLLQSILRKHLKLSPWRAVLVQSVFLFCPYIFRYHFIARGMLPNITFLLGLTTCIWALFEVRRYWVVMGIVIAGLSRQTALLILPGLAYWVWFGEAWQRRRNKNSRLGFLIFSTFTIGFIYLLTAEVGGLFAMPSINGMHVVGLFQWLFSWEYSFSKLIQHFVRTGWPFLSLFIFLAIYKWRFPQKKLWKNFSIESRALFLMWFFIFLQPLLAGPHISGQSASRLAALALLPAVLMVAPLLSQIQMSAEKARFFFGCTLGLLFIGSLHHLYTWIGPRSLNDFLLFQGFSVLGLAFLTYAAFFRTSRP